MAGEFVVPAEADRTMRYACPACDAPVDLHAGEKKRRHFHHRAGASTCTSESALHLSAKRLVVQAIEDWLAGTQEAPVFVRRCAHADCPASTKQPLPKRVGGAVVEHRLRTDHVVDVALLARAAQFPIGAIETLHTHAVDETKAFELGLPWIEVEAAQVTTCANGHDAIVFAWDGRSPPDPRPPHVVAFEAELDATFRRGVCPSCEARLEEE